ncbi:hypothetical protein DPMN_078292 [Dreissena polymorpha]|uniref:Uncharacterized protein n=1 Tax=Dreissena polymorpha TaxID=45954 RepID=A0A9D4BHD2_DREPO|nr:hypothetical protein DPMN_078292 [Dreissena polymorpha]
MNPFRNSVVNKAFFKKDTGGGMSRLVGGRNSLGISPKMVCHNEDTRISTFGFLETEKRFP